MSKSIKNLSDSVVKMCMSWNGSLLHILITIHEKLCICKAGLHLSDWMVMAVNILLCCEGDFSSNISDICTIHTLNFKRAKISSLLHQFYTSQTVLQ